jgi:o-succinylbenzoate synthase
MKIDRVILRRLHLPFLNPLQTSHFRLEASDAIIVQVDADGVTGWGEAPFMYGPWYNEEASDTGWMVMEKFLIPALLGVDIQHPAQVNDHFAHIVGNFIAKSGLEFACWDCFGRAEGKSIASLLGGTRSEIPVGVSMGIYPTVDILIEKITRYIETGYNRIKLKIKPGWDIDVVAAVRERWPDIWLQVDANNVYTLDDIDHLKQLDAFDLLLIEQPFAHDDIIDHAKLQAAIKTPVCLDESIISLDKARKAIEIDAARVINIKPARVGGLHVSRQIHDLAQKHDIAVWCGGMMETGIGRATNISLASLANFSLPGDVSENSHYFERDIVTNPFHLNAGSTLTVPVEPGNGAIIDIDYLNTVTIRQEIFN